MFHRNFPWVPIAISVETFPKAPIPGTELDVPRLDAPRGPARGRARANLRDLSTVCLSTIAAARADAQLQLLSGTRYNRIYQQRYTRCALFIIISPNSSCETARISPYNCIYISMS